MRTTISILCLTSALFIYGTALVYGAAGSTLFSDIPRASGPLLAAGLGLVGAGLAKSNGEAVRLLRQRAVRRDGVVLEAGPELSLAAGESFVLSVGPARHVRIEASGASTSQPTQEFRTKAD